MAKKKWIIDPVSGKRKVDKRTPYAALKDDYASVDRDRAALAEKCIELHTELKHEEARNGEIFTQLVRERIETREIKREFVAVGIENADLKVKLAEANREIVKLMGDNVLREVEEEGRVTYGVDPASRNGDYTAFAAIENGEVRIISVRKTFDEIPRVSFELRGEQFEGTASFYMQGTEEKIIEQMIEAYANARPITVELK